MQKWRYLNAYIQGNGHKESNLPCQDYSYVFKHDEYVICVVCDGASAFKNSQIGAENVTKFANHYFSDLINTKKWYNEKETITEKEWKEEAKETLYKIRNELEEKFTTQGYSLESLSCTIIVVIQLKNKLLVTHIGDGRAGYCNDNDEWFSMIKPCKGDYSNETVFITSNIWNDENSIDQYIESRIVEYVNLKAFCLLSDGCENASFECYKYDDELKTAFEINKPFKEFFHDNINNHLPKIIARGICEEELNEIWAEFLRTGNETLQKENDDKSMILAFKINKM